MLFDELLQQERGHAWVEEPGFTNLYVRVGLRLVDGELTRRIDLANFEVTNKGTGVFTRFITKIEKHNLPIFVENVLNDRLVNCLPKLGFVQVGDTRPPCFLKRIGKPKVGEGTRLESGRD